jgi:hypothetical protein
MANLLMLLHAHSGNPVWVNPDHVVRVDEASDGHSHVTLTGGTLLAVRQTARAVAYAIDNRQAKPDGMKG